MSANQENIPSKGGGGGRNVPVEPEYTAEQLAVIKAAMLEELGIGRKDTLPLEDGGKRGQIRDPHPISRAATASKARRPLHSGVSAWQNFQPDDVEEADLQLDSIADGQLYRLRRDDASGSTGGRGGRGRGGAAVRGGHSFTVDRGQSNRGGRGSGNARQQIGRSSMPMSNSFPTPQTYFNDQRLHTPPMASIATRYPAQLDATIARLRSTPGEETPAPRAPPAPAAQPATSSARPNSSVVLPAKRQQRWGNNLDKDAFLKFAGLSRVASKPSQPTFTDKAANQTEPPPALVQRSRTPEPVLSIFSPVAIDTVPSVPSVTVPVELPTIEQVRVSQTCAVVPVVNTEHCSSTTPTPVRAIPPHMAAQMGVGLDSSRWAPSVTDASLASQPPSTSAKTTTSQSLEQTSRGQVFREHFVKVQRENDTSRPGKARLLKNVKVDQDLILELQQDETLVVREIIDKESTFLHETGTSTITYRAAVRGNTSPSTWTILFQMPYQAKKFHEVVFLNRKGHPISRPAVQHPTAVNPAPQPPISANHDASSVEQPPVVNETVASTSTVESDEIATTWSSAIETKASNSNDNLDSLHTQVEISAPPTAPQGAIQSQNIFNFGGLMEQAPIDLGQFALSPSDSRHNSSVFGNRINTETFNDMEQVAGVTPLITLAEEEEPEPQSRESLGAVHDLNLIFDEAMSRSTLKYLNDSPHGSLLCQISRLAVKKGGPPAQGLIGEEILSSELYITVAYDLVGSFLSGSETFSRMPDDESIKLMKQQTLKVLELAVAQREGSVSTTSTTSDLPTSSGIYTSTSALQLPAAVAQFQPDQSSHNMGVASNNSVGIDEPEAVEEKDESVSPVPSEDSRITYTVKDLMQLRRNASHFHWERLSDHVSHLSRPQRTALTPSIAVPTSAGPASHKQLPKQAVSSQPSVPVPAATHASAKVEVISSPVRKNQNQQTDMNLWHSMLSGLTKGKLAEVKPVKVSEGSKQDSAIRAVASIAAESPAASHSVSQSFHLSAMAEAPAHSTADKIKTPGSETPKARLMEEKIFAKLSSPTLSSPPSPSVSALTLPVANARLQAIGAQLSKSVATTALPVNVQKPQVEPATAMVSNVSSAPKLDTSISTPNPVLPAIQHSQEPTRSSVVQPGPLAQASAPAAARSGVYANIHLATNVNLRGIPGLNHSRWSSVAPETIPPPAPRVAAPQYTPRVTPFAHVDAGFRQHGGLTDASTIPSSSPSNPPMLPQIPGVAPVYQTIVVQDSHGVYREVTGMVKAGSIPIVAHMPVPVSMPQHVGSTPNFPARADMYSRHVAGGSDSSDQHFKPDATPFRPSPRGRHDANQTNSGRPALSPVRQGENLQAKLQSRLNNSLAYRGPFPPS